MVGGSVMLFGSAEGTGSGLTTIFTRFLEL